MLVNHPPDTEELDIAFRRRDGELELAVGESDLSVQSTPMVQVGVHLDSSSDKLRDMGAHVGDELHTSRGHERELVLGGGNERLMMFCTHIK